MSIPTAPKKILAIETSCDETAAAVLECYKEDIHIISNVISSQVALHSKWGGVVPNLAAREHLKNISTVVKQALCESGYSLEGIDVLAVTQGPGLIPALLVGVEFAKTLSYKYDKPLIGIHHIEGHIYANFVGISNFQFPISKQNQTEKNQILPQDEFQNSKSNSDHSLNIEFPILCLVVSGGHTQLVHMKDHFNYSIVGQTLDDAAGEAFDKVARILSIGYPGGPVVAARAAQCEMRNEKCEISFPRPLLNRKNFDFSFSGLKTAVLYETKKHSEFLQDPKYIAEVCHEFQQAVVDVLIQKTLRAAQEYQPKTIMLAGGVSANKELRKQLGEAIAECMPDARYLTPDIQLTGDNAAMIGVAAALRFERMDARSRHSLTQNWKNLEPDANLDLR